MKRTSAVAAALLLIAAWAVGSARADEPAPEPSPASAEMLKSMREKGILSEEEYEDIYRRQAMYEAKKQEESKLPGWLDNWTVGGDLRVRFERLDFGSIPTDQPAEAGVDNIDVINRRGTGIQNRARLRFRLGAERTLGEDFLVGFRIATATGATYGDHLVVQDGSTLQRPYSTGTAADPRSANVTFGDFFSAKSIFLDRAYIGYDPSFAPNLRLSAGKIRNPFYSANLPVDFMVWDPDISPEGAAAEYRFDILPEKLWLDAAGGVFVVQEIGSTTREVSTSGGPLDLTGFANVPDLDGEDPYMSGFQAGITGRPLDWMQIGGRVSYYSLYNVNTRLAAAIADLGNGLGAIDDNPLANLPPQNPLFSGAQAAAQGLGLSRGTMEQIVADVYMRFTPFGDDYAFVPFYQYSQILSAHTEDKAYSVGFRLGSPDLAELTFMWAAIERNGTIALFTDSDLFDGFTNEKGFFIQLQRRLTRAVTARAAYFIAYQLREECKDFEETGNQFLCDTGTFIPVYGDFRKTAGNRTRLQVDLMVTF